MNSPLLLILIMALSDRSTSSLPVLETDIKVKVPDRTTNNATGIEEEYDEDAIRANSSLNDPEPEAPRNLSASVELSNQIDDPFNADDIVDNKRLKLVIKWLHPSGGKPPEGYNVEVRTHHSPSVIGVGVVGTQSVACGEHFNDLFHYVDYNEPTRLEIGSGTSKGMDHFVKFGCTYFVTVQSSPVTHPAHQQMINFTVPDCVGGVCRCTSRLRLRKPESLTALSIRSGALGDRSYKISWVHRSPLNDSNASLMIARLERAESLIGSSPIYRRVKEYRQKIAPGQDSFDQLVHQIESRSSYRIRVFAVDTHHCEGDVAEIFINGDLLLEPSSPFFKETLVIVTVLGSVFLVFTALVIALSWRRLLRRLYLMDTAANPNNVPTRYSRPPQIFQRDMRRTTFFVNGAYGVGQNVMNVLLPDKDSDDPRLLCNKSSSDGYEIDPRQLKLGAEIGKGAFGRVHLATAENLPGLPGSTLVAVKQMKKTVGADERDDFLAEIEMMKRVGRHDNIVVMLACVTLSQPYSMILEYVPYGDLLQYLRALRSVYQQSKVAGLKAMDKCQQQTNAASTPSVGAMGSSAALLANRSNSTSHSASDESKSYNLSHVRSSISSSHSTGSSHSSTSYVIPNYYRGLLKAFPTCRTINKEELHEFARQIARGMEHLELKGITHRDLAARNLLVSEGRVLKISDFGLSRHGVYINTRTRMLPLRWLALESMTDNLYSSQSDVWAFGVVLWEICTLGGFPYANVSDAQLMTYLMAGNRLARPENVSDKLYQMMLKCWSGNPDDRPTFQQLRHSLEDFEAHHETYVEFDCSAPTLPPTEEEIVPADGRQTSNPNRSLCDSVT